MYVYVLPDIMSLCGCLSVCLCAIYHLTKIDQAGEPETFFNFVWPKRCVILWDYTIIRACQLVSMYFLYYQAIIIFMCIIISPSSFLTGKIYNTASKLAYGGYYTNFSKELGQSSFPSLP